MNQLNLPMTLNAKMLWRHFIGDKNQQILAFLSKLLVQYSGAMVYIFGTKSSGKTHLLQGCAFAALKKSLSVVYIDLKHKLPDGALDNLANNDWLCIDNIDCATQSQQYDLFDLYNRAQHTKMKLLISGNRLPSELDLFKDLKTRLSLATIFTLELLDDASKKRIIAEQMNERNLQIDTKIYNYLFKHYSRDLSILLTAINQLDEASLQYKNRITIPLVKQVLNI